MLCKVADHTCIAEQFRNVSVGQHEIEVISPIRFLCDPEFSL